MKLGWRRVAVAALLALGLLGAWLYGSIVFGASRLNLLFEPPEYALERGVVTGEVRLRGDGGTMPCSAYYRVSKSDYTSHVHGGATLQRPDGTTYRLVPEVSIRLFGDPRRGPDPAWEKAIRARLGTGEDLKVRFECIGPDDAVFVEACLGAGEGLVPCEGDDVVRLSAGKTHAPLVKRHAAVASAWLGAGMLCVALAIALLWREVAFARPEVGQLVKHLYGTTHTAPPKDLLGFTFVGVALVMMTAVLALVGGSPAYILPAAAALSAGLLAYFLLAVRRR